MNKITEKMQEILKDAPQTILVKGRKTYALDAEDCPVDSAALYVNNELHKLVPPPVKKAKA